MEYLTIIETLKKVYDKLLTDVAKKYDLTLVGLKILMYLPNSECDFAKNVVCGIQATKSHVSMATADLEEKGYLEKVQDEKDKKQSHLQITPKALNIIQEGYKVNNQIKDILIEGLTKEELNELKQITKKMYKNIQEHI